MALPGLFKYFKEASEEEREHAYKLLEYQNKRGGKIVLTDIEAPEKQEWGSICEAMNFALELEKRVNDVSFKFRILMCACRLIGKSVYFRSQTAIS